MSDDIASNGSTTAVTEPASSGIDIESVSAQIGADLFGESQTETEPETAETVETVPPSAEKPAPATKTIPAIRQAPKSWIKDMHDRWAKIDPDVQTYIEKREKDFLDGNEKFFGDSKYAKSIRDVLSPYQQLLDSKGLDAPRAIDDMLGAYRQFTTGTMEQRQAALLRVAQNLGIQMPGAAANGSTPTVDPRVQALEQQFQQLNEAMTAQQRAAYTAAHEKATKDIAAFANDPAHSLFDEVTEDIGRFIQMGDDLQTAYDKAVWANPVTREKQKQSWFQTETEKAKENARLAALPKKQAKSVNVQSRDTQRTPTDTLGSMEDTMRATLKEIKGRVA